MDSPSVIPYIFLLLLVGCSARPLYPLPGRRNDRNKQPLQTFRAYNIAHRGSNGEIPEETAAAYMRAIEEGTDFIETDILASKDGALICFHDVILDDTTDIANHKEFADRKRTYDVQGVNTTGYFLVDFTLEELKLLRVKQRYPFRDQQYNGEFSIITFEEFISIALDAHRVVGIYPEIKNPVLINQHVKWSGGKKFEDKFVETLKKYGYKGSYMSKQWLKQPAFIQSFAPTSLIYISNQTDLPKIFLIDDTNTPTQDTNQSYWEITSDGYLIQALSNMSTLLMPKKLLKLVEYPFQVIRIRTNTYIRMVQNMLERCLVLGMDRDECIKTLAIHARIRPLVTLTVWRELIKENKDFFQAYFTNISTPLPSLGFQREPRFGRRKQYYWQ